LLAATAAFAADEKIVVTQPSDNHAVQITIDTSETPELTDWAQTQLRPVLEKWYPIIERDLASDGFTPPRKFKVVFLKDMKGVADTSDTRVRCAAGWFKRNLKGEAIGAVVHEMVHVVQRYPHGTVPGWLIEGTADYIRWFKYEPVLSRPHVDPDRAKYTDSYRTSAAFLNYVAEAHDQHFVKKLNAVMREGKYNPDVWKELTGKTVDELWDAFMATLKQ
jgi:hypothetical protein